jgi:hypothetical protein
MNQQHRQNSLLNDSMYSGEHTLVGSQVNQQRWQGDGTMSSGDHSLRGSQVSQQLRRSSPVDNIFPGGANRNSRPDGPVQHRDSPSSSPTPVDRYRYRTNQIYFRLNMTKMLKNLATVRYLPKLRFSR